MLELELLVLILVAAGLWSMRTGESIFSPRVLLAFVIVFGVVIRVLVVQVNSELDWGTFTRIGPNSDQLEDALATFVFAMTLSSLFLLGYSAREPKKLVGKRQIPGQPESHGRYRVSVFVAAILILFGVRLYLIQIDVGLNNAIWLVLSRMAEYNPALTVARNLGFLAAMLSLAFIAIARCRGAIWLAIAVLWAFCEITIASALLGRAQGLVLLIGVIYLITGGERAVNRRRFVPLILVAVLFVVYGGLLARFAAQNEISIHESMSTVSVTPLRAASNAFPLVDHLIAAQIYVDTVRPTVFDSCATFAAQFVPRAIWADKPVAISLAINEALFKSSISGLPPGLIGEGYILGGTLGAAMASCFVLFIMLKLHQHRMRLVASGNPFEVLYLFILLVFFIGAFRTGLSGGLFALFVLLGSHLVLRVLLAISGAGLGEGRSHLAGSVQPSG